jgi:hypothetical protein
MATAREGTGVNDFPLVRGGKIPPAALRWLAEVERIFSSTTKDIILIRKPNSLSPRGSEIGNSTQREGKDNGLKTT